MKKLSILLLMLSLQSCGWADRVFVTATGQASSTCYKGVLYLQFTSGASVAYNQDGSVRTCR